MIEVPKETVMMKTVRVHADKDQGNLERAITAMEAGVDQMMRIIAIVRVSLISTSFLNSQRMGTYSISL